MQRDSQPTCTPPHWRRLHGLEPRPREAFLIYLHSPQHSAAINT